MGADEAILPELELRAVLGLTRGLAQPDLESLTINAIRSHRQLVERADKLFQALPAAIRNGESVGGTRHLEYIDAMIEMHAQMSALSTLISLLGYTPKVSVN